MIGLEHPNYIPIWQVVGMFLLVYSPAYFWIARNPEKHYHLVIVAFLGTLFGLIGFIINVMSDNLDRKFGIILITNDLVWIPMFCLYIKKIYAENGIKAFFNP